jgi:seryl-tRNA synthetase
MFDVAADCFRHEPSRDVDRFQSFRMREFVLCALPDQVLAFRTRWMARGPEIADTFGVKHQIAPANDPFFGRTGKLMAINQIEQALKFELLIPVRSEEQLTACMSFNYHRDHFGAKWGLIADTGEVIHTGCVAFGIDRLVLALSPPTAMISRLGQRRHARLSRSERGLGELNKGQAREQYLDILRRQMA